jgi:TetR/AcrR family transcriptional regulator, transcriptional repressor for nem operon
LVNRAKHEARWPALRTAAAERAGLPGPGCLVSNTMVEVGPHDAQFGQLVNAHLARIKVDFLGALVHQSRMLRRPPKLNLDSLDFGLTVNVQGLWSISRTLTDAGLLRTYAKEFVNDIEEKLAP